MDKTLLEEAILNDESLIRDAYKSFEVTALGVVFICDPSRKLLSVATEGDVRRALLDGHGLNTALLPIANPQPIFGERAMSRDQCLTLMSEKIHVLPILDEAGRIVDFFYHDNRAFIPVASPTIGQLELKYVTDAILSGWVSSSGKYIDAFESDFAHAFKSPHACVTSNGTVALHLALTACGIGDGDEVIVPALTFIAPANAVLHTGAKPVFVDVNPQSWTIDPVAAEAAITEKTKAIIPVHLYGTPCDMDALVSLAKRRNLLLIEDAAESHGALYDNQPVGSIGDIGCFSFFGNKILTTGEGGMVLSQNSSLDERMRMLRDHGMSKERRYWHTEPGFNYRMTNVQAAIGVAQLKRFNELLAIRRRIESRYDAALSELKISKPKPPEKAVSVCWLYTIALEGLESEKNRDRFLEQLTSEGIDCRPTFYPIPAMPPYYEPDWESRYPNAKRISNTGFSLPTLAELSGSDIDSISAKAIRIAQGFNR